MDMYTFLYMCMYVHTLCNHMAIVMTVVMIRIIVTVTILLIVMNMIMIIVVKAITVMIMLVESMILTYHYLSRRH